MINLKRTDSNDLHFSKLVSLLDADLKIRDGAEHDFYNQFNAIANIKHCLVAYNGQTPVGCGCIKPHNENVMEVKRMYVMPEYRGNRIASILLTELETCAKELGFSKCVLETGLKQPEAIALYKKCGYQIIENYGQYKGIQNSLCFEKIL